MTIARADGSELVVHELMSSPINQFTNKIHAFLEHVEAETPNQVKFTVHLDETEFYGRHSNVMLVRASLDGLITWEVYRTKGVEAPPRPAFEPLPSPFQL
jgi:hypothetical protein